MEFNMEQSAKKSAGLLDGIKHDDRGQIEFSSLTQKDGYDAEQKAFEDYVSTLPEADQAGARKQYSQLIDNFDDKSKGANHVATKDGSIILAAADDQSARQLASKLDGGKLGAVKYHNDLKEDIYADYNLSKQPGAKTVADDRYKAIMTAAESHEDPKVNGKGITVNDGEVVLTHKHKDEEIDKSAGRFAKAMDNQPGKIDEKETTDHVGSALDMQAEMKMLEAYVRNLPESSDGQEFFANYIGRVETKENKAEGLNLVLGNGAPPFRFMPQELDNKAASFANMLDKGDPEAMKFHDDTKADIEARVGAIAEERAKSELPPDPRRFKLEMQESAYRDFLFAAVKHENNGVNGNNLLYNPFQRLQKQDGPFQNPAFEINPRPTDGKE